MMSQTLTFAWLCVCQFFVVIPDWVLVWLSVWSKAQIVCIWSSSGIFLHPPAGVNTPYFFLYTPRPIWVGNPPWGGGQVSDRCRGSTGHFLNRPNTVCWGDTGESAAAAHPHRVELAGRQPPCHRAVARHSSRSPQCLLSLLCLHARPSTGAAAAR